MASTVPDSTTGRHLPLSEIRPRPAKADLRKAEMAAWKVDVGRAIERARSRSGLSLKEFADKVGRDERQCKRWETGEERPQMDAIFAVPELRQPIVVALAEIAGEGVEVITEIRVKRSA